MKRIRPGEITVGEALCFDCYDASGLLLLKKGLLIASEKQFGALLERGLYQSEAATAHVKPEQPERKSPFHMLDAFRNRLAGIFAAFANPEGADIPGRIRGLCADIQALCRYDADAALGALHLDHEGRYTIIHPLHVAILCELIAQRKAMAQEERIPLLAAALTANVSIIELQETLQRQTSPLTPEQQRLMRLHPLESVDRLLGAGVGDDLWIKAVLHHHEKLDGSGYPGAMRGDNIPLSVRVLSLADTYSAMVTPRSYRGTILAKEALRDIFLRRGSEMDAELAQFFVRELSVFPPGAFVKLRNGETAIVIRRGKAATAPVAKSVLGPRGAPLPHPLARDCSNPAYEVHDMVPRDFIVPIDLHQLWDYR